MVISESYFFLTGIYLMRDSFPRTERRMSRDTRTGPKEVLVEYLTTGVSGVEELEKAKGPLTRRTLRDAMKELQDRGTDFRTLEAWCREKHGFGLNNRHTSRSPKTGEEREYKVQGKAGAPFMKLPLATLGVAPGGAVKTAFMDGKLVTTLA
jgi:hypothetical protein